LPAALFVLDLPLLPPDRLAPVFPDFGMHRSIRGDSRTMSA
jgi:hypothetical protein